MANVLAALGGAAAGIANALQEQRQFNMQKVLATAMLASQGGGPGGPPDPNDPTAPSNAMTGGSSPISPAAALMSGATPSTPLPPPNAPLFTVPSYATSGNTTQSGTAGSIAPSSTANLTQSGVGPQLGNTTQSGTSAVPTDQASVINMARQAQAGGVTGGSASGANGGGVLSALAAGKAATASPGMSGTPTPSDPIGGINSGLMASVMAPPKMVPVGKIDGQSWSVPQGMPAYQAQGRTALLNAMLAADAQQRQQQFAAGQEEKGEQFSRGQQQAEFAQQSALEQQRSALQIQLGKANNAVQYAQIAAEIKRADVTMALMGQGKADAETQKVTADLKPYEDQLPTIAKFQAITPQMAASNPAATQQAVLEAFQTGVGGSTFPARLAKLAKAAPGESIEQVATRVVTGLANGTIPADQFQGVQQQVQSNKDALRAQHNKVLTQDLAQYPMAAANPALRNRTDALFGPAGQSMPTPEPKPSSYPATDQGYQTYLQAHAAWQTAQTTRIR